jgi:8-oxo-dGTP pyrophosphatase MutT (NUDIX family)/phosphohistidine phosphatase SixA
MTMMIEATVYAAGAVCWRRIDGVMHVLVIHRTGRRDISLPKGKVDPGETLPETAVREILEETGLSVVLGVPVGITEYVLPSGRDKVVHYWSAEVTDRALAKSSFTPNEEVESLQWLTVAQARDALSYDPDRIILDNFSNLVEREITSTFAIIALRHAKALDPFTWEGHDQDRPLAERGLAQAQSLVPLLSAWSPLRLVSSTSLRCRQTIAPLATSLGRDVRHIEAISQHAFELESPELHRLVNRRIRARRTTVVCTHGPVLPELVREVALATGTPLGAFVREASDLDTGAFTVLHLSATTPSQGIVAIETHGAER